MLISRPQPGFVLSAALLVLLVSDLLPHPSLEQGVVLSTFDRVRTAWVQR